MYKILCICSKMTIIVKLYFFAILLLDFHKMEHNKYIENNKMNVMTEKTTNTQAFTHTHGFNADMQPCVHIQF